MNRYGFFRFSCLSLLSFAPWFLAGCEGPATVSLGAQSASATMDGGGDAGAVQCMSPPGLRVVAEGLWTGALALDSTSIYWADKGGVETIPRSGGAISTLTPAFESVGDIAVDATDLYLTAEGKSGFVLKMPKSGGTLFALASGQDELSGLAVDAANVYWTTLYGSPSDGGAGGTVMKVPKSGGTPVTLASGQQGASAVAVDEASVYWVTATYDSTSLRKMPIDGGEPVTLASMNEPPIAILGGGSLVLDANNAYWVTGTVPRYVVKVPKSGGDLVKLAYSGHAINQVAVDDTNVYWAATGVDNNADQPTYPATGGFIMRTALTGGPSTFLADCQEPAALLVDSSGLYWSSFDAINVISPTPK
jgi:hypothetical protein